MRYSNHAIERMGERNLCKANILGVLMHGKITYQPDGRTRHSMAGIHVVLSEWGGKETVVTVFVDRALRSNKRKHAKRRGTKKQTIRTRRTQ